MIIPVENSERKTKHLRKIEELAAFLSMRTKTCSTTLESDREKNSISSRSFSIDAQTKIDDQLKLIASISSHSENSLLFLNFDYENVYHLLSEIYVKIILALLALLNKTKNCLSIEEILSYHNEINFALDKERAISQSDIDKFSNFELASFLIAKIIFERIEIFDANIKEEIFFCLISIFIKLYENYLQLIAANSMYEKKDDIIFTHNTDTSHNVLRYENQCANLYYEYYDTKILERDKAKEIFDKNLIDIKRFLIQLIQIFISVLNDSENIPYEIFSLIQSIYNFINEKYHTISYAEMKILYQQRFISNSKYLIVIDIDNTVLYYNSKKGEIKVRPFFEFFINEIKQKFDIVLVSSIEKAILNCFVIEMKISNVIRKIFIRKPNTVVDNIKKYFKENLRKILLLSNEYSSSQFFPSVNENLLTLSFFNPLKEDDVELKHITTLIKRIADIKKDVREVLNEYRI